MLKTKEVLLNRLSAGWTSELLNVNPEIKQIKRKKTLEIQVIGSYHHSDRSISIELVKEMFTNMFKEQKDKLLNIGRNGLSDTNVRLHRLTQEISDSNIKLNDLIKKSDELKLRIEISQDITDKKFKEINNKLKNDK